MTSLHTLSLPDWPPQNPKILRALQDCFESGEWGQYESKTRNQWAQRLAERHHTGHCQLVSSGTVAIELALRISRVGRNDEVAIAAYDFPGNFRNIELLGAKPVLIDVGTHSFSMTAEALSNIPPGNIKAVVVSHLHGHITDMQSISQVCKQREWCLIEDACQAIGMMEDSKPVGTYSDVATLSFGGSKLVSAGCGGAILLRDPVMIARLRALAMRPSEVHPMSALQVAVASPQLDQLDEFNRKRTHCVNYLIQEVPARTNTWRWLPSPNDNKTSRDLAYYKLAFLAADRQHRARVIEAGKRVGLPLGEGFRAMHQSSKRRCRRPSEMPNSKLLSESLVVLDHRALLVDPEMYPRLAETLIQVHDVAKSRRPLHSFH